MTRVLVSLVVLSSLAPSLALAATTAGDVTTPYPTLEAISIEWAIDGDDDADGRVTVHAGRAISRAYFRNNLFLGGAGGGTYGGYGNGDGSVIRVADADDTCSFDHDGFGSTDTGRFEGRLGEARFTSLPELRASTTEANAVEVSLGDFAATITHPSSPFPEREVRRDPRVARATDTTVIDTLVPQGPHVHLVRDSRTRVAFTRCRSRRWCW